MRSGLGHYERGQRAATQPFKNHWCPLSSPCPSLGVTDESQIPLMCSLTYVPCQRKFPSCRRSARLPPRSLSDMGLSSEASAFIERVSFQLCLTCCALKWKAEQATFPLPTNSLTSGRSCTRHRSQRSRRAARYPLAPAYFSCSVCGHPVPWKVSGIDLYMDALIISNSYL